MNVDEDGEVNRGRALRRTGFSGPAANNPYIDVHRLTTCR
jgi:hypothetical protein